jgi:hypothetical protein
MGLDDPQQVQNNEDDGNDDQGVDPTACLRDAGADVRTQKAEQPQDYKNYDDGIQHEVSPFLSDLLYNPAYNKPSPAASIRWGGFLSATWGREVISVHAKHVR